MMSLIATIGGIIVMLAALLASCFGAPQAGAALLIGAALAFLGAFDAFD